MDENQRKKNILLTAVLLAVIAIISAILIIISLYMQNSSKNQTIDYSAEYVAQTVIQKMNYQNLTQISSENISKYYDVPKGIVIDSAMYISNLSDSGTEVACFKLNDRSDNEDRETLSEIIADYTSSKISNYKDVNDHTLLSKTDIVYPYVFVVISSDPNGAVTAFENVITNENPDTLK